MAKDDQAAPDVDAGGNKKKFIIIGAVVAAVVLAGVIFMMMKGSGKSAEKKDGGEAKVEAKAGAHGAAAPAEGASATGGKEGAAPGSTNMYPIDAFIVNIYDGQELRYLKVKVEVEMVSPAVKADLDSKLAPIRDAILVLLSTKTLQEVQEIAGKTQLKDEILSAINKHIPPGKIAKVYFTDFVVQ